MPTPIVIPRINSNDDVVKLSRLFVEPGTAVTSSTLLAEIETDKANFEIEAESDGFILQIDRAIGDMCEVGSTLLWIGASKDEMVGGKAPAKEQSAQDGHGPSLKALLLLHRYGLDAASVSASGERLSAEDVEAYAKARGLTGGGAKPALAAEEPPASPGRAQALSPQERGMVRTVSWHRDAAAAGYIEVPYDATEWERFAAEYQERHRLVMSPLLSLMAWQLTRIAAKHTRLNATIAGGELYLYDNVNLGFTVQSGDLLMMPVVRVAQSMEAPAFVEALGHLQRLAMKLALRPDQASGATIAFTSMARWGVCRHMPILPPHTSFIAAHSAPQQGQSILGACYDHRVLTGFDVARALCELAGPPAL